LAANALTQQAPHATQKTTTNRLACLEHITHPFHIFSLSIEQVFKTVHPFRIFVNSLDAFRMGALSARQ
jgi:hypothetical protein